MKNHQKIPEEAEFANVGRQVGEQERSGGIARAVCSDNRKAPGIGAADEN
jgi:hypothetical protein